MIIVNLKKRTITIPGTDYVKAAEQAKFLREAALVLGKFFGLPGY